MKRLRLLRLTTAAFLLTLASCHDAWLTIKPDKKLVVPASLEDLQALLDNSEVMNTETTPSLGEMGSDDFYITSQRWNVLTQPEQRNAYLWAGDIYEGQPGSHWWRPYQSVLYANLAIEGLESIERRSDPVAYDNISGSALFYRSWAFFHLAQVFCKPYHEQTAQQDAGLPLREESDMSVLSVRARVQETYDRIFQDLLRAAALLPQVPLAPTRPSKAAAFALLAKAYLQIGKYPEAGRYADSCLQIRSELINFNDINVTVNFPFQAFNKEVIFHATPMSGAIYNPNLFFVDSVLFNSYDPDDLRKAAYFRNVTGSGMTFKGSYTGSRFFFNGIATGEMYLVKAESLARQSKPQEALAVLTDLLRYRYRSQTFSTEQEDDSDAVLRLVLEHRRKELVFRCARWADLRRLNLDDRFKQTLTRHVNGSLYTLPPGDSRYVLPIPEEVIAETGMEQNIR